MALQFLIGSSGSGKSYKIYKEIADKSVMYKDQSYIIIVPEQFTLQTQKDIVNIHSKKGILNIDVLSFMRLAYRIFDELGQKMNVVLEDTGKNMILRKVIEKNKDTLDVFKGSIKKQGFISELKSLISEFYQYSITPDDINEIISKSSDNRLLQIKLKEVSHVYTVFKEYLEDRYITAEEILDILYNVMDESKILKDSIICLDGFTGFTPVQYKILSKMMHLCKKVIVSVTIDPKENIDETSVEYELFNMSKKTISKLKEIAVNEHVQVDKDLVINEKIPYRYKDSEALAHLEANIFRYPYKRYAKEQHDITITPLMDAKEEAAFVLRKIKKLVAEKNYRYKDIAIVTGDIASYGRIFERIFDKEGISYFIDNKKGIMDNPFIEMIRAAFEVVNTNYSYESVFRYLRSGMTDIDVEDIDIFENFVIALGKAGKKMYMVEWKMPKYIRSEIDIDKINEIRKKIYKQIGYLVKVLKKDATVKEFTIALYQFIDNANCEEKLEEYRKQFEEKKMFAMEKEYSQIYKLVIDLLDKMVDLLDDEVVSVKEYIDIFEAGVSEIQVGLIPISMDQLVIGDIERTRLKDIKALFFVGVNDNIIPKEMGTGGIISDLERELLLDKGVELSPTRRQAIYIEQFYLYISLTKPKNKLYITYNRLTGSGECNKPSYLIGKLKNIFPKLKEEEQTGSSLEEILDKDFGIDYLVRGLRQQNLEDMTPEWKQILSWYKNAQELQTDLKALIDGAYYSNTDNIISKAVSEVIYGDKDKSVTEIEKYASCAYAHFLQYGLKLRERDEYEIKTPDLGDVFHSALENFSQGLNNSVYDWKNIPDEFRDKLINDSVDLAVSDYGNYIFYSSKRNEYMINRIKRMARKTVWALCEHVKAGKFVPSGFELKFASDDNIPATNINIQNDKIMGLKGFIDRIDLLNDENEQYVKVIDYKSGSKDFEPSLFFEGIQLQLIVYMNVAIDKQKKMYPDKEIIPAGVFYYHIDDPIIEKTDKNSVRLSNEEHIDDITNEMALDKLVMKGIVNSDKKVLGTIDENLVDETGELVSGASSKVTKVIIKRSGEIDKKSNAVSKEKFDLFRSHANRVMKDNANKMYNGDVEANPYKMKDMSACDYCKYNGICGFDIKLEGSKYKKIFKKELEEVVDKIAEKGGDTHAE